MHESTSGECASPSDFNHEVYPFRVAPGGWKGGFDDATCWKRNIDGIEGDSLGGPCDASISAGSVKDISVVIRTCSKSVSDFCEGSS